MIVLEKQEKYYNEIIADLEKYNATISSKHTLLAFIKKVTKFATYNNNLKGKTFKGLNSCGYARKDLVIAKKVEIDDKAVLVHGLLNHCGSISACPVCSQKIANARVDELQKAFDFKKWLNAGMITLTAPHHYADDGAEFVKKMNKAFNDLIKLRKGQNLFKNINWARVWEMNFGRNGWHYHFHVAVFSDETIKAFEIKKLWLHCLLKNGLIADVENADVKKRAFNYESFDLNNKNSSKKVSRYLNKLAFELAHSSTKKAKKDSLGFFDICKLMTTSKENFDKYYLRFCEYLVITKNLRCRWSKDFRKMVNVKTDEEIASNEEGNNEAEVMWGVNAEQLKFLRKSLMYETYLELAKKFDINEIKLLFENCGIGEVVEADEAKDFEYKIKHINEIVEGEKIILQEYKYNKNKQHFIDVEFGDMMYKTDEFENDVAEELFENA